MMREKEHGNMLTLHISLQIIAGHCLFHFKIIID